MEKMQNAAIFISRREFAITQPLNEELAPSVSYCLTNRQQISQPSQQKESELHSSHGVVDTRALSKAGQSEYLIAQKPKVSPTIAGRHLRAKFGSQRWRGVRADRHGQLVRHVEMRVCSQTSIKIRV